MRPKRSRRTSPPPRKAGRPEIELSLTGLAYGGEALGRDTDGRVVFVPFALPGERVQARLLERRKRWARAQLVQVLQPAPEREIPRCRHFTACGGCHYQHMPYPDQLQAKQRILRDQLERLGKVEDPPVEPCLPAVAPWNTRNQLQFHLDPAGRLGFVFHGQAQEDEPVGLGPAGGVGSEQTAGGRPRVLAIQECHLPEPALSDLWPRLGLGQIPGLQRVGVRCGRDGEAMVILHGQGRPEVDLDLDLPISVVWVWPEGLEVLAGSDSLIFEVGGREFSVSAPSFFQVQTALAAELVRLTLEGLAVAPGELVYDLYAGVGLFSAFLAAAGARVIAVEQSPWACEDFEHNLEAFEGVALYETTVEEALPGLTEAPQAVVVDPPRAGLAPKVIDRLIELAPPRLVYVSCDPATLARDAVRLQAGGYRLERVIPIDFFPQTYHIEAVTYWRR